MNHIEELEKQREKHEDNLVLQTEVMELIELRRHKLNGHGNSNGKNNGGGRLKRLLLMK